MPIHLGLGLHHVDVQTEIMYPTATPGVAEFGPGDLTGLYSLGSPAGCLAQPDPWWLRTSIYATASRNTIPVSGDDLAQGAIATASPAALEAKPLHCDVPGDRQRTKFGRSVGANARAADRSFGRPTPW